jgi:hypothetical protein
MAGARVSECWIAGLLYPSERDEKPLPVWQIERSGNPMLIAAFFLNLNFMAEGTGLNRLADKLESDFLSYLNLHASI